ncbi:hypothetical protein T459_07674 [Capsicum annuum]|uniref:Amine oxidase domain-containing protein n=1 Tax=Capsicum annuum TaxID=4072 RepID=A0A2G2ZUB4_CAPAN|nr:hypothetical protein T459_07674 [Capsicum annuum]
MKVAAIGAGISGLVAAYELAKSGLEVEVYEKEDFLGGHANIVTIDGVDIDLGFMVFNSVLVNMKVAVVGARISGLVSAYELAKSGVNVVVYEKKDYVGGHAKIVAIDGVDIDLGFMVFNWHKINLVENTPSHT